MSSLLILYCFLVNIYMPKLVPGVICDYIAIKAVHIAVFVHVDTHARVVGLHISPRFPGPCPTDWSIYID